jgi:hypothetical protein
MKTNIALTALASVAMVSLTFAQNNAPNFPAPDEVIAESPSAEPPPDNMGSPTYEGMAPTLPPPDLDSAYAGPTMLDPSPESIPVNGWGSTMQQSIEGGTPLLNYSYAEAGYRFVDPKINGAKGSHGLGVALVMDLPTIFFLKGSFNWTSGSTDRTAKGAANANYKLATITIGGGAYMAITSKFHIVGEAGLVYANFDADGINKSYTDAGVYVRPSLRYQALDWLELQAGVTVSSTSDYDSKTFDFGGYFRVLPQLDLNVGADIGDVNRTFKTGARLRW